MLGWHVRPWVLGQEGVGVGHARGPRFIGLCLMLLAVVSPLALGRAATVSAREGRATEETPLRAEPDDEAAILILIPAETTFEIEGRAEEGYYPVSYGGVEGWIATGFLATRADERRTDRTRSAAERVGGIDGRGEPRGNDGPRSAVADEDLNLRVGPGTEAAVQRVIPAGDAVLLTGRHAEGFLEIRYGETEGWARGEYLVAAAAQEREPSDFGEAEIVGFIEDAAAYYDQPVADMLRVARCESDLVPRAVNSRGGSYGIFQFKTGTWLSTPYAEYDIFDPRASAYAAGWMWSVGRRNEWVCQ